MSYARISEALDAIRQHDRDAVLFVLALVVRTSLTERDIRRIIEACEETAAAAREERAALHFRHAAALLGAAAPPQSEAA